MMTIQKLDRIYDSRKGKNWDAEYCTSMEVYTAAMKQYLKDYGWNVDDWMDLTCPVCGEKFEHAPGWAVGHNERHVENHEIGQLSLFREVTA